MKKSNVVRYLYTGGDSHRKLNTSAGQLPKENTAASDLLELLVNNHWVPLAKIIRLGIGCYGNVIGDLRDLGWSIINRRSIFKNRKGRTVVRTEYGLYQHVIAEAGHAVRPLDCGHKITDPKWETFRR